MPVQLASVEIVAYCMALALQYGLPALLAVLTEWQKVDPTMTDLEALKGVPIDPDLP